MHEFSSTFKQEQLSDVADASRTYQCFDYVISCKLALQSDPAITKFIPLLPVHFREFLEFVLLLSAHALQPEEMNQIVIPYYNARGTICFSETNKGQETHKVSRSNLAKLNMCVATGLCVRCILNRILMKSCMVCVGTLVSKE